MATDRNAYGCAICIKKVALPGVAAGRMGWGNRFKDIPIYIFSLSPVEGGEHVMYYEFGEAVRSAREGKGWTRVQASMRINGLCKKRQSLASVDAIEKWENGRVLPKIEPVYAMAKVYDSPELIHLRLNAIDLGKRKIACVGAQTIS
ncbi:hypothetical protein SPSIL_014820 [Sporomusa silvacetica DSM 10669]|uniref:HTH cro/C1-type domain-containing protein n=1 Tax=Sporomusa silvacetica DSM 10669 TaxID=1123289 RepID=A0ABZ3II66_9FIRM|nr:helix-turn-helix transcriptional regulator [Sporomusa silvacetica]OZC21544.1 hypothetical protein SPSIL_09550 [Sporomusa silvacetica DSM 10669]